MNKILVVEDDADINNLICTVLKGNGYEVTSAFSGSEAKLLLKSETYDCLLLDLMLPAFSGEELIGEVRKTQVVPIIVMSAKPGVEAKINALKLGADDFVSKPLDIDELLARVEAQIRRSQVFSKLVPHDKIYKHKNCVIDTHTMTVKVFDKPIELTALEYELLLTFISHPKQIFTRQALFDKCWGDTYSGTDNTVDVHISHIRTKLAEYDDEEYIKTVRGIGYRLSV